MNKKIKKGKKNFSFRIMECRLEAKVSAGMFLYLTKALNDEGDTFSNYMRTLIMQDRGIDEFGEPINKIILNGKAQG